MRGEFVDLGGARIYCYAAGTRGAGEPIVFIHGFPTSSHLWEEVVPLVPEGHRIVVLDLLGYGRSDRPLGRDLSIRAHADRVIQLLDALGINYACVIGHDLGGGIAQSMAIRHPTRVSRLCLIDSVAFDDWPVQEVKIARATLPLTRHLPTAIVLPVVRLDLLRGYVNDDRGSRSLAQYMLPFDTSEGRDALMEHLAALDNAETVALEPRLKDIVQPTAIIWGAHDPWLPTKVAKRLHAAIPKSTLDIVPDIRHFVPEEAPERIGTVLRDLLAR